MVNVPDTTTFSLIDVKTIVNNNTNNLSDLFIEAIENAFDGRYISYPTNSLLRFRNYGTIPISTPIITLVGASTITLVQGGVYSEYGATAIDAIDGNITANIVTTGTVNTAVVGTYYKYYNVTNSSSIPAAQVTRTIIISSAASTIVCLYGDATYQNPVNYNTVVLNAVVGYNKNTLAAMGVAMGSTASLSSMAFVNTGYQVRLYDNGYPSTDVDFTGNHFVVKSTCPHNENFNYYVFSGTANNVNDNTRSLCVEILGTPPA